MAGPSNVIVKRLRVHQDRRGELQPGRAAVDRGADPDDNESWWAAVLWDPRLKLPTEPSIDRASPDAGYRLDRHPRLTFQARCPCGLSSRAHDVESLLREVGPACNTVHLARHLIDCKRRN